MAIHEEHGTLDQRTWIELSVLGAEGLTAETLARLGKSEEVRRTYVGFRLFVARDSAREWLQRHAPSMALPKTLAPRKRVLTKIFSGSLRSQEAGKAMSVLQAPSLPPEASVPKSAESEPAAAKPEPQKTNETEKAKPANVRAAVKGKESLQSKTPLTRPSGQRLRALYTRLQQATTKQERRAVYDESGYHPVALARWFRAKGFERVGDLKLVVKRGRGRPRKEQAQPKSKKNGGSARLKGSQAAASVGEPPLKLARGLSLKTREMAVALLVALLAE